MTMLERLPKPFFVLAPMDDVTDTVFRQVIAGCAPPDLFFTEFVNVDALQSEGRAATLPRLKFTDKERPLIAQLWGLEPENFYKSAKDIAEMGFDGADLNFGCPVKDVVQNGACSALILPENRGRAAEIIQAVKEGLAAASAKNNRGQQVSREEQKLDNNPLPLSVKTRLGFNNIDYSWAEFLLKLKLNMLTIHGRTRSQMSKTPADWDAIQRVREQRDELSPGTLIVGNGDVLTHAQGLSLAEKHKLDGIMIGRGVFQDPFVFAVKSPWANWSKEQKIALYHRHVELFAKTYDQPASRTHEDAMQGNNEQRVSRTNTYGEREAEADDTAVRLKPGRVASEAGEQARAARPVKTLNKFCKVYINGFDGAKEMREKLMKASSTDKLLNLLSNN